MPVPLLAVEVGNSRWKCGLFLPHAPPLSSHLQDEPATTLRLGHADDPAGPLRRLFERQELDPAGVRVVSAGVNPAGADRLAARWPAEVPRPVPLPRRAVDALVENRTREPDGVGLDRLLNAVGTRAHFGTRPKRRDAVAVADCGTATTVDLVLSGTRDAPRPKFMGGAILPGAASCAAALRRCTALLPEVDLEVGPEDGRDTAAAIRRGVLEMQAAAVDRLLADTLEHAPGTRPRAVLTGGAAGLIRGRLRTVDPHFDPHLTLCGLAIAAGKGS